MLTRIEITIETDEAVAGVSTGWRAYCHWLTRRFSYPGIGAPSTSASAPPDLIGFVERIDPKSHTDLATVFAYVADVKGLPGLMRPPTLVPSYLTGASPRTGASSSTTPLERAPPEDRPWPSHRRPEGAQSVEGAARDAGGGGREDALANTSYRVATDLPGRGPQAPGYDTGGRDHQNLPLKGAFSGRNDRIVHPPRRGRLSRSGRAHQRFARPSQPLLGPRSGVVRPGREPGGRAERNRSPSAQLAGDGGFAG